jgi:hypothetical protein
MSKFIPEPGSRGELFAELAKRPEGVTTGDPAFADIDPRNLGHMTIKLVKHGLVFRARMSYRTVIYFGTQEAADAALQGKKAVTLREKVTPVAKAAGISPLKFSDGCTVTFPTNPDGSPAYKITIAPPIPDVYRSGWGVTQAPFNRGGIRP